MSESAMTSLAGVIILGIGAQWLAWRLKIPSILFLLVFGFIAGPITGFLHPNELLGQLLLPVVAISVGIILFEGGLSLKFKELREIGKVVLILISVGMVVTWFIATAGAYTILGLDLRLSILLGAILVVTGPTVVGPMLRHIRPVGKVADILKWEGIVIDPIGALLAVVVFEAILIGEVQQAGIAVLLTIGKAVFLGGLIGLVFAWALVQLIRRFWIPDYLHETVTLTLVIGAFVGANALQEESGLFAATVMGFALDERNLLIKHIIDFKENLSVLMISGLFILLSARLQLDDLTHFDLDGLLFLALLICIARPAAVMLSTIGSGLSWRERVFVSWLAPRGIVAAAVASVFALRLADAGIPQAETLVPITFMVIIGTVAIYGLTSPLLARWLGLAQANPQGALIIGAHAWGRAIAESLKQHDLKVLLVDTNRHNTQAARMQGLSTYHGSILSEEVLEDIDLSGIGRLLALTSNDEANSLAALHFADIFDRGELYQLSPASERSGEEDEFSPVHLRGRFLFGEGVTFDSLDKKFASGWRVKSTKLSEEFDYEAFCNHYGDAAIVLFIVKEGGELIVVTTDSELKPEPGQNAIAFVKETEQVGIQ